MMGEDREKLIGVQTDSFDAQYNQRQLITPVHTADYLIANGVTFATDTKVGDKWTPTAERLPDANVDVLVVYEGGAEGRYVGLTASRKTESGYGQGKMKKSPTGCRCRSRPRRNDRGV